MGVGDVPDNFAGVVDRVGVAARGVVDGQQIAHVTVLPPESVVGAVGEVSAAGDVAGGADPVRGASGDPGGPDGEGQAKARPTGSA